MCVLFDFDKIPKLGPAKSHLQIDWLLWGDDKSNLSEPTLNSVGKFLFYGKCRKC